MDVSIRLRPVERGDIDDEYCAWYSGEDGHLAYFTGSGRVFTKETLVEDFEKGRSSESWFYYLIESGAGDRIGTVKIGPIDRRNKTSDLVCLVGNRNFLGKGIGSRAIALANEVAFKKHDIRRLQGGMYATNVASIKSYVKAGWFVEATMRGFYWSDNAPIDRVCVACLNPQYFPSA